MLFARPCTLLHLLFSVAPHIICFPSLSLTTIMSTFAGYNYEPESLPSEDDGDAASSSRLSKRGTRGVHRPLIHVSVIRHKPCFRQPVIGAVR